MIDYNLPSKPIHFNQQLATKTLLWSGIDTEQRFTQNCADQQNYKKLQQLGWLDNKFTYVYNSEGFRDEEFDQQPAALALGCSHTEGVGIPIQASWPRQLQNLLGLKVWNLGSSGAALDTCFRLLDYWIIHLNVKYVFCAMPGLERYEVFENNHWSNVLPTMKPPYFLEGFHKNYLAYRENSDMNRRKNLLAMEHLCSEKSIEFYYEYVEDFFTGPTARDLQHCGPEAEKKIASAFYNKLQGHHANTII